jgi:hypothetical protein
MEYVPGLLKALPAFGILAQRFVNGTKMPVGKSMIRIQLDEFVIISDGQVRTTQTLISKSKIIIGGLGMRVETYGFFQLGDSFGKVPLPKAILCPAQVIVIIELAYDVKKCKEGNADQNHHYRQSHPPHGE